ncbi:hypothetical protein KP509_34G072800 [Ceratopteris richardii]|uniref:Uncharacterized protein n=1 Tax=Ceratopteris richardii TaxID=49495 RepID=A0A8T2QMF5_CERRI|nr:hypothetical protein KP509_34G072800 [Ceratopteris richardii]
MGRQPLTEKRQPLAFMGGSPRINTVENGKGGRSFIFLLLMALGCGGYRGGAEKTILFSGILWQVSGSCWEKGRGPLLDAIGFGFLEAAEGRRCFLGIRCLQILGPGDASAKLLCNIIRELKEGCVFVFLWAVQVIEEESIRLWGFFLRFLRVQVHQRSWGVLAGADTEIQKERGQQRSLEEVVVVLTTGSTLKRTQFSVETLATSIAHIVWYLAYSEREHTDNIFSCFLCYCSLSLSSDRGMP